MYLPGSVLWLAEWGWPVAQWCAVSKTHVLRAPSLLSQISACSTLAACSMRTQSTALTTTATSGEQKIGNLWVHQAYFKTITNKITTEKELRIEDIQLAYLGEENVLWGFFRLIKNSHFPPILTIFVLLTFPSFHTLREWGSS